MTKKPFNTRLDETVLDTAQRIAKAERRSVTSVIEVAVLAYEKKAPSPDDPAASEQDTAP